MATPAAVPRFTVEEYVEVERTSELKFEYRAGEVHLMGGGTRKHSRRATNAVVALSKALDGRDCEVHGSDQRVRIESVELITYPDASVVCGQWVMDRRDANAMTNPYLLVAVLSPSTERFDRGEKLRAYQTLPSVQEVVFVAHDPHRIDVVQRQPDGTWRTVSAGPGESVDLLVGCSLAVDAVYFDRTSA